MEETTKNLPAIQVKYQAGNALSRVENAIVVSNKINVSSEEEISTVLRYIMVMLGLRIVDDAPDLPTPIEKAIIMEYLLDECANITPEELKLAFKLGLAGKTGMKTEDTQLYGKRFSAAIISKFVNAYNIYKQELRRANYNKPDPNQKQLPEANPRTPEQQCEDMHQVALNHIKKFNVVPDALVWDWAYKHLESKELIKMSDKEKAKFKEKVRKKLNDQSKEKMRGGIFFIKQYISGAIQVDELTLQQECRKEAAIEYYQKLVVKVVDKIKKKK